MDLTQLFTDLEQKVADLKAAVLTTSTPDAQALAEAEAKGADEVAQAADAEAATLDAQAQAGTESQPEA